MNNRKRDLATDRLGLMSNCQVTQRDSFHLCQTSIPVALQPITTSASIQRGQNMLYFRPGYGLFHKCDLNHKMAVAATLWFLFEKSTLATCQDMANLNCRCAGEEDPRVTFGRISSG
jgi:hypothetical protein